MAIMMPLANNLPASAHYCKKTAVIMLIIIGL